MHVRVKLKSVKKTGAEEELEALLDLVVDDNYMVIKNVIFFGVNMRKDNENIYPFIIRKGEVDYGSGEHIKERSFETDIYDKEIKVGEYIELDGTYKITSVDEFGVKK